MHDTTIYTTLRPGPQGHWRLHLSLDLPTLQREDVLRRRASQNKEPMNGRDQLRLNAGVFFDRFADSHQTAQHLIRSISEAENKRRSTNLCHVNQQVCPTRRSRLPRAVGDKRALAACTAGTLMRPAVFGLEAPKVVLPIQISTELRRTWPKPKTYAQRSHQSIPFISSKRRLAAYLSYIASATSKFKLTTTLASNVGASREGKPDFVVPVRRRGGTGRLGAGGDGDGWADGRAGDATGSGAKVPIVTGGGKGSDGIKDREDSRAGGHRRLDSGWVLTGAMRWHWSCRNTATQQQTYIIF